MINSSHVKEYINFLHLKKYSAPAPEELKSRWASVPEQELPQQLQGLYQHWGIDTATASLYEQLFQQTQSYNSTAAPVQPPYPQQSYPQAAPPPPYPNTPGKSSKMPALILGVVLVLAIAGFAFYWISNHKDNPETTATDSAPATTTAARPAEPAAQNAVEPVTEAGTGEENGEGNNEALSDNDAVNMEVIRSLINAEESRNMSGILNSFSSDMEQYWDISYPSQEELVKRYNSVWSKSGNGKHNNVRIEKVADDTYDLFADYEFYSNKDHVSKAVTVHVRYVFDSSNKIVKTFGVK